MTKKKKVSRGSSVHSKMMSVPSFLNEICTIKLWLETVKGTILESSLRASVAKKEETRAAVFCDTLDVNENPLQF